LTSKLKNGRSVWVNTFERFKDFFFKKKLKKIRLFKTVC
jgi:hypothetical protein